MATKTPGKKLQTGQRMAHLFPSHHETLKRSERKGGKALEKGADRVVAESLENSMTNRCVNLMWLDANVCITIRTLVQNECMISKFFCFTLMKIEQNCIFLVVHLNSAALRGNTQRLNFTKPPSRRWAWRQWRDMIQNTNQMKMKPAWNFVAMFEKVFF